MEKRTTLILGLLAVATAALGIHLLRTRRARRTATPWHPMMREIATPPRQ